MKYYDDQKVTLKTHHIRAELITRIRKGYASIYDITEADVYKQYRHYLEMAKEEDLYVVLEVIRARRLLIFNKKTKDAED